MAAASSTPTVHGGRELPLAEGLPFLGNLLELRRDRVGFQIGAPRRWPSMIRLRMGIYPHPVVMVNSAEIAAEVLVEKADAFTKAPGLSVFGRPLFGNGLLTSERDVHRRQRKMMAPMFVQKRIAAFAEVMVERAEKLSRGFRDGATIDLSEATMLVTLEIVGKTLFDAEMAGDAREIGDALTECLQYIVGSMQSLVPLPPSIPSPSTLRYKRAIARLDRIIYGLIRERRASGVDKGDLLSMLLAAQDEDDGSGMDDKQIRDELMTIFLAGHETTANALAWTFHFLALHPHVRVRMEEELDAVLGGRAPGLADLPKLPYTLTVFKESMRLRPPAYVLGRQAARDVEVAGMRLAKGTVIMVNVIGIHHRADYFLDPERFDPSRFTPENEKKLPRHAYLPFGGGSRICIGNHFAMMEGHLLLVTLARKIRFDLVPGVRVRPEPLVTLRPTTGKNGPGMPMRVRLRG